MSREQSEQVWGVSGDSQQHPTLYQRNVPVYPGQRLDIPQPSRVNQSQPPPRGQPFPDRLFRVPPPSYPQSGHNIYLPNMQEPGRYIRHPFKDHYIGNLGEHGNLGNFSGTPPGAYRPIDHMEYQEENVRYGNDRMTQNLKLNSPGAANETCDTGRPEVSPVETTVTDEHPGHSHVGEHPFTDKHPSHVGEHLRHHLPRINFDALIEQVGKQKVLKLEQSLRYKPRHYVWLTDDGQEFYEPIPDYMIDEEISLTRRTFARERAQMKSRDIERPTGFKKWKFERGKEWQKNKKRMTEFFNKFEIWRKSLKKIEGQFGAAVSSYFGLVRWLMFLNLFITITILSVIVFPHQFLKPSQFNETIVSGPNDTDAVTEAHINAHNCSASYSQNLTIRNDDKQYLQYVLDFFQGTGWMEEEVMFMGWYFNKTLHFKEDEDTYNVPLAYLLTTAAYFLVILVIMVRYTAGGARSRLVYRGDKFYMWCSKVFCGWDYLLCQEKAAGKKHDGLFKEYLADLAEQKREMEKKTMSTRKKVGLFTVRLVVNLIVLAMLGGAIALIYFVVAEWTPALLQDDVVIESSILTLLVEFLPSVTITVLNSVLPLIFEKLVLLESYSPDGEVKITIVRTVFLRLASVVVLLITIRGLITCEHPHCGNCYPVECWETFVGQQFYRLIILDFLVVVIFTFLVEFPRKLIVKKFYKSTFIQFIGYQEFNIPKNVLDIVYSQTISWFGGFFSPLVPAITVIKFFTFFYVKKVSLLNNCIPCKRSYGASRTMYFFMFILLISFVLITPFLLYAIGIMKPSHSCGPFRVYTRDTEDYFMYTVVSDSINQLPDVLQTIIRFLWSWMVYVPLMVIVCLLIFYYYTVTAGNKKMIALLKDQLALEGKDKQFLLARVNEALMRGDFATE